MPIRMRKGCLVSAGVRQFSSPFDQDLTPGKRLDFGHLPISRTCKPCAISSYHAISAQACAVVAYARIASKNPIAQEAQVECIA
jgi:hypothetical protein